MRSSYGLKTWSKENFQNWLHDLTLMLIFDDLVYVKLEVYGHENQILFQHAFYFTAGESDTIKNENLGLELPVLSREIIAGCRVIINNKHSDSHEKEYRKWLRINWCSVEPLHRNQGDSFVSRHTAASSKGKNKGEVWVDNQARRHGVIYRVIENYAFARDEATQENVFLHTNALTSRMKFMIGQRVSYIPIQTKKGMQGMNIQSA